MAYDPIKAHEYYERTKKLKPRKPGSKVAAGIKSIKGKSTAGKKKSSRKAEVAAATQKLARLGRKIQTLNNALKEAKQLLSEKRRDDQKSRETKRKTEKENSDGKSSSAERAASKKYRDKNKGGAKGKDSGPKEVKDMSVDELEDRVSKIQSALRTAKAEVKKTKAIVSSLKHSEIDDSVPTASSFGVGLQNNQPKEGDSQNGSNP